MSTAVDVYNSTFRICFTARCFISCAAPSQPPADMQKGKETFGTWNNWLGGGSFSVTFWHRQLSQLNRFSFQSSTQLLLYRSTSGRDPTEWLMQFEPPECFRGGGWSYKDIIPTKRIITHHPIRPEIIQRTAQISCFRVKIRRALNLSSLQMRRPPFPEWD